MSGRAGSTSDKDRRAAPRLPGMVEFRSESGSGEGLVKDLSLTGLHVGEPTWVPKAGDVIELSFCHGEERIPARAEVTRWSEDGFAAHFTRLDKRLQQLLIAAGPAAKRLSD